MPVHLSWVCLKTHRTTVFCFLFIPVQLLCHALPFTMIAFEIPHFIFVCFYHTTIITNLKLKINFTEETDIIFDDWKNIHLPNIFPTEIKKSIHYDIKVRPFEYLNGMLYMNSVLEKQENKLFQPLPLRNNIIPKHIIIDTASLINLF